MANDPINPAHYNGKACAFIGQHLTGNGYQVLKYNWRLGRKDDVLVEIGKSIWYLDEEIALAETGWTPPSALLRDLGHYAHFPTDLYFDEPLHGQDPFVQMVAWALINWTKNGDIRTLQELRKDLVLKRAQLETERTGQLNMVV